MKFTQCWLHVAVPAVHSSISVKKKQKKQPYIIVNKTNVDVANHNVETTLK